MRIFDWFYIGLLLASSCLQLWDKVSSNAGGFASRYGAIILAILFIISILAHRRHQPILKRLAWRALFWAVSAASVLLLVTSIGLLFVKGIVVIKLSGLMVSVVLLLIPGLLNLYHYSAKRNPIWNI